MLSPDSARDLASEFHELNDQLFGAGDINAALEQLVTFARSHVPGCTWAAITAWPSNGSPWTRSHTGAVAQTVDQLQFDIGDGPCLAAAGDAEPVHIPDLASETRWQKFCRQAQKATPVRSILCFQLATQPQRLALNLYSDHAHAFDDESFNTGALFAAHAGALMLHAHSAHDAAALGAAVQTNRRIGTAIGILMNAHKVTDDQAFTLLRTTSQNLNRKLRDVATDVTESGELPTHTPNPQETAP